MTKYNIGQVLTYKKDVELEGCFGDKRTIKKGTKAYIGADKFVHYLDETMQPLGKQISTEGYSVKGIADWVYMWISARLPLDDFLEEYEISEKEFRGHMEDALEELGMWDNTGNRS